jgi:hypothetical protein
MSSSLQLVHRNALPAKMIAFAEEALAGEAFHLQCAPFIPELVPEFVELSVVWTNPVMAQLVQ